MSGYKVINLADLGCELGEKRVIDDFLSDFSCPLNEDVEKFLKEKAIEFSKQGLASTHLIFSSYQEELVLIAYFTIANKFLTVEKSALSAKMRRKIGKFCKYDTAIKRYILPAPLIAQLGKNFFNGYNNLISGDELLKIACDKIKIMQEICGGKIVYLECEDKPCLLDFYSNNGFVNFGQRKLDKEELGSLSGKYLIQMLRYF